MFFRQIVFSRYFERIDDHVSPAKNLHVTSYQLNPPLLCFKFIGRWIPAEVLEISGCSVAHPSGDPTCSIKMITNTPIKPTHHQVFAWDPMGLFLFAQSLLARPRRASRRRGGAARGAVQLVKHCGLLHQLIDLHQNH